MLDHLNLSLAQPTHRTDVIPPFSGRKGVIKQRSCESSKEILESLRSGTYVRHGLGRIEGLPEGLPADGTQQAIQAFVDRFIDQPIERTAYEPALRHLAKEAIAFEESQPPFPSGYACCERSHRLRRKPTPLPFWLRSLSRFFASQSKESPVEIRGVSRLRHVWAP